jgi:hypothetical protein
MNGKQFSAAPYLLTQFSAEEDALVRRLCQCYQTFKTSAESYPLPFILGVISAES